MSRYKAYLEHKDSGADWFDSVPEQWDVKRISYVSQLRSGDAIVSDQIEVEGDYPVYGGNGLRGYCSNFNLDGDFILIGRQGALCGNITHQSEIKSTNLEQSGNTRTPIGHEERWPYS